MSNDPDQTIRTNAKGKRAADAITKRQGNPAALREAMDAQDRACRDAYEILADMVAVIGKPALARALAEAGENAETVADWFAQIAETRQAFDAATLAITKAVYGR